MLSTDMAFQLGAVGGLNRNLDDLAQRYELSGGADIFVIVSPVKLSRMTSSVTQNAHDDIRSTLAG
jgi:hypothetical protein